MENKVLIYYMLCLILGMVSGNYTRANKTPFWKILPLLIAVNLCIFFMLGLDKL